MLKQELENQLKRSSRATAEVMIKTRRMINDLKATGIEGKALSKGQKIPIFQLLNPTGKAVCLRTLLNEGPLVITFYRGSWCPLCNLELRAFQSKLDDIRALGASLVAITPERPDLILDSEMAGSLEFEVLTDVDNQLARAFGLVFEVPEEMLEEYVGFGINVAESNGTEKHELPVPATYVVNMDGTVTYAFVNANYLERAEPADVITALQSL